ncbi:MAG TPA: MFS transporter [bacterium]|nr:MFS transporter [bacterium]
MKPKTNIAYRLLISAYAISTFSEGIIVPIYAIFVQKIGGDILDAGLAMGIFLITQGLFTVFFHKLNWNPRFRMLIMIGGWMIWLLGLSLYLVVSSVGMLFLTQILTAIGNAVADPIFDEELSRCTDKKKGESQWAIFEGGNDLMSGLAAILGGLVASAFGFLTLIWTMIIAATISLLTILFYVHRFKKRARLYN